MAASGWQVDIGRQVDTALGLSESSSTLCSAGHSSGATCDAASQLGGQVGAAAPQGQPDPVTTLSLRQHTCPTHHSLICIGAFALYQFSNVKFSQILGLQLTNITNFLQTAPSPLLKNGGGSQFHLSQKTLFSVHNMYFENWQLKIQAF